MATPKFTDRAKKAVTRKINAAIAKSKATHALREDWLQRAIKEIAKRWATMGVKVPADVAVSCGWPGGGSARKRIGECWSRAASEQKVNQVFISPLLGDPIKALDVLGHELIHAADDCESGHGHEFTRLSKLVGYTGGKHSCATPGEVAWLKELSKRLGTYPHKAVKLKEKKQRPNAGLQKYSCTLDGHEDVLYTTASTADENGPPRCRICEEEMKPHKREKKKLITKL